MSPGLLEVDSAVGRVLIALGFFAFVGLGYVALALLQSVQDRHKRGLGNINPYGCTAAAFVALLLMAWARGYALR